MGFLTREDRQLHIENIDAAVRGFIEHIDGLQASLNQCQQSQLDLATENAKLRQAIEEWRQNSDSDIVRIRGLENRLSKANTEKYWLAKDLNVTQEANATLRAEIESLKAGLIPTQPPDPGVEAGYQLQVTNLAADLARAKAENDDLKLKYIYAKESAIKALCDRVRNALESDLTA